jgi:DNA processing protein
MNQPRRPLNPSERLDWLRLIRSENVGPVTFRQLLGRFGSARAALDALPELARRGGRPRPLQAFPRAAAERELAEIDRLGAELLASIEPDYPLALAAIDDAPPLIAVRGHRHLLGQRSVGIVGARNASANGRRFAETLAHELGQAGLVVVSGLARGIDAAAHRGSLATGTIAVLAGGIDVVYPPEHEALHAEVAERGALVAELPPRTTPQARHFPRRNRLISGISLGIVVVEAALRSGSLITARFALEQGREVFAVPGSPLDPRAQGANNLIREGATLVETAADVLAVLDAVKAPLAEPADDSFAAGTPPAVGAETLASARKAVGELLGPSPVAVDELIRQCPFSPPVILTVLLELELAGRLERHAGNRVSVVLIEAVHPS